MTAAALPLKTPAAVEVFAAVLALGPIGRAEVGRRTGLSPAAVTKAVAPLVEAGIVREEFLPRAGDAAAGRPVHPLVVVAEARAAVGVKITHDEVIGVLTGLTAGVRETVRVRLADSSVEVVVAAVEEVVRRLVEWESRGADASGEPASTLLGVGVAITGEVDVEHGVARRAPLLGWRDVALRELLEQRLGLPVLVENDVRALTVAEQWFGVGARSRNFAVVTIGAGIGCGLHVNGDVVSGGRGVAGELGHLPFASVDDECRCGRRGCLEAVAATWALERAARAATGDPGLDVAGAAELARAGHPGVIAVFDRAGAAVGSALAAVANLVGPDTLVLAGEGTREFDLYERRMREKFADRAFGAAGECELVVRPHSFDDWARGAAAALIRDVVRGGAGWRA